VLRITENSSTDLNELCTKLELHSFNERELSFLKEYHKVLKTLARGLDILQGEEVLLWYSVTDSRNNS